MITYLAHVGNHPVVSDAGKSADLAARIRARVAAAFPGQPIYVRTMSARKIRLGWFEGPEVDAVFDDLAATGITGRGRAEMGLCRLRHGRGDGAAAAGLDLLLRGQPGRLRHGCILELLDHVDMGAQEADQPLGELLLEIGARQLRSQSDPETGKPEAGDGEERKALLERLRSRGTADCPAS